MTVSTAALRNAAAAEESSAQQLDDQTASWRDPDFALNAVVRDFLVRFRGIGGENDNLLIFERIEPATTKYPGGLDGLTDAIISRVRSLASRNDAVHLLVDGKKGVGIV